MKISCLNPIAAVGMQLFTDAYEKVDDFSASDAALVRSASVHELELPDQLLAIARAGSCSCRSFPWRKRYCRRRKLGSDSEGRSECGQTC